MSSATGIRLHYCEMESPGNLPCYPPEQHYGRCRKYVRGECVDLYSAYSLRTPNVLDALVTCEQIRFK